MKFVVEFYLRIRLSIWNMLTYKRDIYSAYSMLGDRRSGYRKEKCDAKKW